MHTDPLKQALADMETAWRRLREVLDGPDVAAALVERQAVRPMSTAPRDGTRVWIHLSQGGQLQSRCVPGQSWVESLRGIVLNGARIDERHIKGWSPVK